MNCVTATATFTVTTIQVQIAPKAITAYLETCVAQKVVEMMRREVRFQVGAGARCPLCGSFAGTRSGYAHGVRYHVCPECDHRFSSVYKETQ